MADIAILRPGAATAVACTGRVLSDHGVVSAAMQPSCVLAVPHAVADNDRVCPNVGGPDKEQTFRSGRDLRRNGLSPMIVGR